MRILIVAKIIDLFDKYELINDPQFDWFLLSSSLNSDLGNEIDFDMCMVKIHKSQ